MASSRSAGVNCAKKTLPAFGVKRLTLTQLLSANGCGLDHTEPHRVKFNVVILITRGYCNHMVDFAPQLLQKGDLLLLRAGQVHAFAKAGSIEGEILTFTQEFVSTLSNLPATGQTIETLLDAGPRVSLSESSAASVLVWYEELSRELGLRGQPHSEERIALSFALLVHRVAALEEFTRLAHKEDDPQPSLVREFTALLEEHFLQHRNPAWYARKLGVSARTLDRRLVESVKHTCKELVTSRVLLEAKRLLTDPELQVKGVAHSLRFDEVANFSRFFHHNAGVTPSNFRAEAPDWQL